MNRSKMEWLKEHIDKLSVEEHTQLLTIIKKYTDKITTSPTGVFVSSEHLSEECLLEMDKYVVFCIEQSKRMEEYMKTRKTYERMV